MTEKPMFHPKPGAPSPARGSLTLAAPAPKRGFDPASLGRRGPSGPKGAKGKPLPLPGKSRGRG